MVNINFKNKTIDGKKYNIIDMWINGVSIDGVSKIEKIKTFDDNYDMIVFITSCDIEHHIQKKSIIQITGTFYDENWNQLSWDEIDITEELREQCNNLSEI